MFLSETYSITDCLKYDKGTTSDHNDIWQNTSIISRGTDYTTLQATTSARGFHFTDKIADIDCKIKFKIHNTSSNGCYIVWQYDTTPQQSNSLAFYGCDTGGTVELTKIGNNVTVVADGETIRTFTLNKQSSEIFRMSFNTNANGDNILISDLMMYSI